MNKMLDEEREKAFKWLQSRADKRGYVIYDQLIEIKEPWLHVPVWVNGDKDAYEVADALQRLEDSWNVPRSGKRPYWKLWLLPAAPPQADRGRDATAEVAGPR